MGEIRFHELTDTIALLDQEPLARAALPRLPDRPEVTEHTALVTALDEASRSIPKLGQISMIPGVVAALKAGDVLAWCTTCNNLFRFIDLEIDAAGFDACRNFFGRSASEFIHNSLTHFLEGRRALNKKFKGSGLTDIQIIRKLAGAKEGDGTISIPLSLAVQKGFLNCTILSCVFQTYMQDHDIDSYLCGGKLKRGELEEQHIWNLLSIEGQPCRIWDLAAGCVSTVTEFTQTKDEIVLLPDDSGETIYQLSLSI